ncbi:hypothetical protein N3K66_000714 [Trichothecium roseum]|uniref:Uncharacterized protein n=1 Tax=Trichothecium roseum TaxID=47278 RepID=A0ACC0VEC0_9HYPO|nr:hypothetical protein N3K66_000714 [Trichothecium roseum]
MAARTETIAVPKTTAASLLPTEAPAPPTSHTIPSVPTPTGINSNTSASQVASEVSSWDASAWHAGLVPSMMLGRGRKRSQSMSQDGEDTCSTTGSVEESCKRALHHFPSPALHFPTPELEFDFRLAVTLKSEPSTPAVIPTPPSSQSSTQGASSSAPATGSKREITGVQTGTWCGSFGNGKVMAGGYDLGQARGFRPIRIIEGAYIMQTTDEPPAILEMRTRGSLSGPCDILDALLSSRNPKDIDPRKYGFRMFLTIKSADKRYAEIVNCGLWVASGAWQGDELIIDAYRVT